MYDAIAPGYNELHGQEQQRKLKALLCYVQLEDGMSVLDVGCATGHLASFFSQQRYTGIDPAKGLLAQAPKDVHVICARGEEIPFSNNTFDVVLSLTALHNYDDPLQGVRELHRVAKDLVLVGVLKANAQTQPIIAELKKHFRIQKQLFDQHDELFVLHKS